MPAHTQPCSAPPPCLPCLPRPCDTPAVRVCTANCVQQEKGRRDELNREKDTLQGQVAELGGLVKSQARLLELEKVRSVRVCRAAT